MRAIKPYQDEKKAIQEKSCALCWGHQEYDGVIRIIPFDAQIEINNGRYDHMMIRKFQCKYVDGYKLKESKIVPCPKCSRK